MDKTVPGSLSVRKKQSNINFYNGKRARSKNNDARECDTVRNDRLSDPGPVAITLSRRDNIFESNALRDADREEKIKRIDERTERKEEGEGG